MKNKLEGSISVEAAVIVPVILFVFAVLIYILFYYHDKNVLMGIAHETAALGSGRETIDEKELEQYFDEQVKGRLLVFKNVEKQIEMSEQEVAIICKAEESSMVIRVKYNMKRTMPENYIRNIRKLEKGVSN